MTHDITQTKNQYNLATTHVVQLVSLHNWRITETANKWLRKITCKITCKKYVMPFSCAHNKIHNIGNTIRFML